MKQRDIPVTACSFCLGQGVRPAPETASLMRAEREAAGLIRREVVPYFLKSDGTAYTYSYAIDLESGSKPWDMSKVTAYRKAIAAAVAARKGKTVPPSPPRSGAESGLYD